MSSRLFIRLIGCAVLLSAGGLLTGCSHDAAVTATEEAKFKNPPKEMPAEAKEYMKNHGMGGGATAPSGAPAGAPGPGTAH